jgi:hypothetical protein
MPHFGDISHNPLADLQGGAPGEHYHLTAAEYAALGVGGTPGGADTNIQFNASGAFDGDAALAWDDTNKRVILGSTALGAKMNIATSATTEKGAVVRLSSSHTANAVEVQDNAGNNLFHVAKDGAASFRSRVAGSDGHIDLVTGANPNINIYGDTANGYYPALNFFWVGGAQTGSISGYNGIFIIPSAGYTASTASYYVNTVAWSAKSSYGGIHSVPIMRVQGYQGANNPLLMWQDGRIEQFGATGNVYKPIAVPTAVSAVASGSGSALTTQTYYYKVTASNFVGETIGSAELSVAVTAGQNVTITWTQPNADGVDHFRVYRATSAGGYTGTSRIDGGTVGVAYYSLSFVDTGAAATAGSPPTSVAYVSQTYRSWAGQSGALIDFEDSAGTTVSSIRADGSLQPASLSDAAAANGSVYYSTTAAGLVYKDSGGTVNGPLGAPGGGSVAAFDLPFLLMGA